MKRKILAIALSLAAGACLALGLTGCGGSSIELVFELNEETDTYTVFAADDSKSGKKAVIPSSYEGKPVTAIGEGAFEQCYELKTVTIPDSITTIGESAFDYCISLKNVTIPDSVTSIGDRAFFNCYELTSITIPQNLTKIGRFAFSQCSDVESITVATGNPAYYSAGNCLIVTEKKELIAGCKNSVIPSGVTLIGDHAFAHCDIASVNFPDSVTSIGEYAFSACYALTGINLPDGITSIGRNAFEFCDIPDVSIPATVTFIGEQAFYTCRKVESITVAQGNPVYHSADNCLIETATNKLLAGCMNSVIPDSVTAIGDYAFYACFGLRKIDIPDSVITIGKSAFAGCIALRKVEIGKGVTSIGEEAFKYCDEFGKITFRGTTSEWKAITKGEGWRKYTDFLSSVECTDGTLTEDDIG